MAKFKIHSEHGLFDLYTTHRAGKHRVTRGESTIRCALTTRDLPAAEVASFPFFDELVAANGVKKAA